MQCACDAIGSFLPVIEELLELRASAEYFEYLRYKLSRHASGGHTSTKRRSSRMPQIPHVISMPRPTSVRRGSL
jgi:hypothetical protein